MKSQILKFREMPFEYQRSLALASVEDADIDWTDLGAVDWMKDTDKVQIWIDDYAKIYGDAEYRIGIISIEEIKEKIMDRVKFDVGIDDFDEYHKWYLEGGDTDHGDSVFPIVVSEDASFDGRIEYIVDGWQRFHYYVDKGLKEIPFVEYL